MCGCEAVIRNVLSLSHDFTGVLTINPYAAPKSSDDETTACSNENFPPVDKARIDPPARAILVLALLNIVFDVFVLSQEILYPSGRFLFRLGVPELVVQLTAHVVQALAAHQMLVRGSYKLSCFGAALCCLPFLSQFWILGIPFGVRAVEALRHPDSQQ